mmetsp:Transcript_29363/g.93653  ORF Transcript_29363/g.93653 Transcript_29363/m.93653 type:complete len:110 (+) Transcript_29363:65-394(+)
MFKDIYEGFTSKHRRVVRILLAAWHGVPAEVFETWQQASDPPLAAGRSLTFPLASITRATAVPCMQSVVAWDNPMFHVVPPAPACKARLYPIVRAVLLKLSTNLPGECV